LRNKKVSRPVELERNLLLTNSGLWTNILKEYKDAEIDDIFVDTETDFI